MFWYRDTAGSWNGLEKNSGTAPINRERSTHGRNSFFHRGADDRERPPAAAAMITMIFFVAAAQFPDALSSIPFGDERLYIRSEKARKKLCGRTQLVSRNKLPTKIKE